MAITRRELLTSLGAAAAAVSLPATSAGLASIASPFVPGIPRKDDFDIAPGYTYINGAFTHPMPRAAAAAARAVIDRRSRLGFPSPASPSLPDARTSFATLINARPEEIGWIPNTSTGENLVIEALGLDRPGDFNIVTDELHFEGALIHLLELRKRGVDVRIAPQRNGRVDFADLERLVDRKTKLVEVSWVSMYNGFEHDLTKICALAHAHGAYVYADIIQGVGAIPLDVRATGLDFAATATYKWLMGDFGLAFFFVRQSLLGDVFRRPHWSYASAPDADMHYSPYDPLHPAPVTYSPGTDAASHVQLGTTASGVAAALAVSVPYLASLGVASIQAHRQPLLRRLKEEMPRLGFTPQTPRESTSPIVTFAHPDTREVARKLEAARVSVRVAPHWVRIAPSVYNDMADVERLLDALR